MPIKVLILYTQDQYKIRSTMRQYIKSFSRYSSWNCVYANIGKEIPNFLIQEEFDVVILHYSFLANVRFLNHPFKWKKKINRLSKLRSNLKVALPQDEYLQFNRLYSLFRKCGIDIIGTTFVNDQDIQKYYLNNPHYQPKILKVLTGYIDPLLADQLKGIPKKIRNRNIDVGYRARKIPYYCGAHGEQKHKLIQFFKPYFKSTNFIVDIENTDNPSSKQITVFKEFEWYRFLMSCKAVLGCEGGSSLMDVDGSIRQRVNNYLKSNPNVSFQEVKNKCFATLDYNLSNFALGPRNLETVLTKTVQILIEGNYNGILIPWKHYLPLKQDFSNVDEILDYLSDSEFCQNMVNNTYNDLISDKSLYYEGFISLLEKTLQEFEVIKMKRTPSRLGIGFKLRLHLLSHWNMIKGELKSWIKKQLIQFFNLNRIKSIFNLQQV